MTPFLVPQKQGERNSCNRPLTGLDGAKRLGSTLFRLLFIRSFEVAMTPVLNT